MRVRFYPLHLYGTISLACSFLLSVPGPSLAQNPAPTLPKAFDQHVKLDAARMSFNDILTAITKQAQVSILVDDEPLLKNADMSLDGTVHDVLDKVADTFDYSWRVSKAGVVLMSKRFKNPDERPQMNIPEMLEMTRSMVRALTLVDYDKDEAQANDVVKRMAQTFTPEQTKALTSESKLHGSDLSPAQKTDLQQAILTRTFLPAYKLWEATIPLLYNIKRSGIQAKPRISTPTPGSNAPTHDYFSIYRDADGTPHSFEIQHMVYGDNNVEFRTP